MKPFFFLLSIVAIAFAMAMPTNASAQQVECEICYPCELGIQTEPGLSHNMIVELNGNICEEFDGSCGDLIQCPPHEEEDTEELLSAVDAMDWDRVAAYMREVPDGVELVPERGVLLVKQCSAPIALREVPTDRMKFLLAQQQ